MAREHVVEAFLVQHLDADHEAVQHLRRRRIGEEADLVHVEHVVPGEERLRQLGGLRLAFSALSLMALNDMPGGSIRPFCAPPTETSTPHSSWR